MLDKNTVNASELVHQVIREAFLAANIKNYTQAIEEYEKPPRWQSWGLGIAVISLCSYSAPLGILLLPFLKRELYERIMTFLIALGIGALSGSTLFIMVPQAFGLNELDDFDFHTKSSIVLSSLYLFFSVDRLLQYFMEYRRRCQAKRKVHASTIASVMHTPKMKVRQVTEETTVSDASTSENNAEEVPGFEEKEKAELEEELDFAMVNNALARTFSCRRRVAVLRVEEEGDNMEFEVDDYRGGHKQAHHVKANALKLHDKKKNDEEVAVSMQIVEKRILEPAQIQVASVAYMLIFGSSANNFVDGMSMGAAFSDSILRGLSIGIAVISQQFPQELGTLAILIKSGLGIKRTLLFNMIPIFLSYVGFAVGVMLDNVDDSYDTYIFAISSGMYMYIFLGTLIPEIRESTNELIKTDLKESFIVTALQFFGVACGIFLMIFMSSVGDVDL